MKRSVNLQFQYIGDSDVILYTIVTAAML